MARCARRAAVAHRPEGRAGPPNTNRDGASLVTLKEVDFFDEPGEQWFSRNRSVLTREPGWAPQTILPARIAVHTPSVRPALKGMEEISRRYNEGGRELYVGAGGREHD